MNSFCGKVLAASLVLVVAATAKAMLGGFGVSVFLPTGSGAQTKDAFLMVQPIGCHGPGAAVSARAEGLVNGARRSIPLKLILVPVDKASGEPETYMLKREWPAGGTWVLVITAKKDSIRADSLVTLDREGKVLLIDRPHTQNWDGAKVLSDGKTRIVPWSFRGEEKVVAMQLVSGNVGVAVDYTLKTRQSQR